MGRELIQVGIMEVEPSPDNYRRVRTDTEKFRDLAESIRTCGVLEPILVRRHPAVREGDRRWEILSGHRRWMAASSVGMEEIPAIDYGRLSDERAYDIIALGNEREDLTPLEEGRRVAIWLDKYGQDTKAVASKLGKSERWVQMHAQIEHGLSAEWKQRVAEKKDCDGRLVHRYWTASHLAVLARLPASRQAEYLNKAKNDYRWGGAGDWSVRDLEHRVKTDPLYLAKAPFDVGTCRECVDRTDRSPLLWGETAEESTGAKARCLDPTCWKKKALRAEKAEFKDARLAAIEKHDLPYRDNPAGLASLSLLKPKNQYYDPEYDGKLRAVKRVCGKGLLTADQVEIVKKDTKGAVPALVVAGRGKGGVKWIKVKPEAQPKGGTGTTHQPSKQQMRQHREAARWQEVWDRLAAALKQQSTLAAEEILYLLLFIDWPVGFGAQEELGKQKLLELLREDRRKFGVAVTDFFRQAICDEKSLFWVPELQPSVDALAGLLGLDPEAIYDEVVAEEARTCRVCGCTQDDCSQCVEAPGEPCHWVEDDLCSRCAAEAKAPKNARGKKAKG